MELVPSNNVAQFGTSGSVAAIPHILHYICPVDNNFDVTGNITVNEALAQGAKLSMCNRRIKVYFTPPMFISANVQDLQGGPIGPTLAPTAITEFTKKWVNTYAKGNDNNNYMDSTLYGAWRGIVNCTSPDQGSVKCRFTAYITVYLKLRKRNEGILTVNQDPEAGFVTAGASEAGTTLVPTLVPTGKNILSPTITYL